MKRLPPGERPRAPHAPRGRRAGLRLLARDGHGSVSAGDIAGGGRPSGADPCRYFLSARAADPA